MKRRYRCSNSNVINSPLAEYCFVQFVIKHQQHYHVLLASTQIELYTTNLLFFLGANQIL